jgi:hypothetical protein
LYFYGTKETGKSRAGELLAELAFRAERSTSPTEAVMFREADYYKTSLIIDEIKLLGQDGNKEVLQLLKSRYKRGIRVSRVNINKNGEDAIEKYDVFGATVLCTTEKVGEIIESRTILFTMTKNSNPAVERAIDPARAAALREQLLLFRFKFLAAAIPTPIKPAARRRLGEILTPLLRILLLCAPENTDMMASFNTFISDIEKDREVDKTDTHEYELLQGLAAMLKENKTETNAAEITRRLNQKREKDDLLKPRWISDSLKRLSLKPTHTRSGNVYKLVYAEIQKLCADYGLDIEQIDDPEHPF